jgi:hypothetical protein
MKKSAAKIGDIFQYVDTIAPQFGKPEADFYVLAKSKNPNKPKTVGLWLINPQTMIDRTSWKFRKMWHQTEVKNPNNLTKADLKQITDPNDCGFKFIKLSENAKEVVKSMYAGKKLVPDADSFKILQGHIQQNTCSC